MALTQHDTLWYSEIVNSHRTPLTVEAAPLVENEIMTWREVHDLSDLHFSFSTCFTTDNDGTPICDGRFQYQLNTDGNIVQSHMEDNTIVQTIETTYRKVFSDYEYRSLWIYRYLYSFSVWKGVVVLIYNHSYTPKSTFNFRSVCYDQYIEIISCKNPKHNNVIKTSGPRVSRHCRFKQNQLFVLDKFYENENRQLDVINLVTFTVEKVLNLSTPIPGVVRNFDIAKNNLFLRADGNLTRLNLKTGKIIETYRFYIARVREWYRIAVIGNLLIVKAWFPEKISIVNLNNWKTIREFEGLRSINAEIMRCCKENMGELESKPDQPEDNFVDSIVTSFFAYVFSQNR